MVYSPNIPQPTDKPQNSQPLILQNFQDINSLINVNHVGFDVANAGKHNLVEFVVQTDPPSVTLAEVKLYNFGDAITGINELFIQNALGNEYSVTASILSTDISPGNNSNGWKADATGILFKWGFIDNVIVGIDTADFPVSAFIPVFAQCFTVLLTPYDSAGVSTGFDLVLYSMTNTGFTFYSSASSGTLGFQYLAIGF